MVLTVDRGRMAAAIRLFATGNIRELRPEETCHERLSSQSIYRELQEADEPNLLEEEDMHVFGCKPLEEPLDLVCCNACKKTIKASQYAAHAECCRLLDSLEDVSMGSCGGTGHKKPPRKGRKKFQTAHGEHGKSVSVGGRSETAASECNSDNQTRKVSSLNREQKGVMLPTDRLSEMNGSRATSESTVFTASVMSTSEEHNKLAGAEHFIQSSGMEATACLVVTEKEKCFHKAVTCTGDFPVPLATKRYHSQRNHLRAAIGHLYYEALTKDRGVDTSVLQSVKDPTSSLVSSSENLLQGEQNDDAYLNKNYALTTDVLEKSDQTLTQSSEQCLCGSASVMSMSFQNHIGVDPASISAVQMRYHLSTPYSFPRNSGTTLDSVQQPKESISVT